MRTKSPSEPTWATISRPPRSAVSRCRWAPSTTWQLVQLRTGYHYGERRDYYPSYWTVGAGLRILHLRLDFAYLFAKKHSLLRNTYSISFGLDF